MKKATIFTIIVLALALLCSCTEDFYEYKVSEVSNIGTVTSSVVDGVTTVTIQFGESLSCQTVDKQNHIVYQTKDNGRYDTIINVFAEYGLVDAKKYRCSISSLPEVNSISKYSDKFYINSNRKNNYELDADEWVWSITSPFTMTIYFGGETIINYSNLPISPEGLAPGTLWNDNGTIKIV